jgi:hypothetical protein
MLGLEKLEEVMLADRDSSSGTTVGEYLEVFGFPSRFAGFAGFARGCNPLTAGGVEASHLGAVEFDRGS